MSPGAVGVVISRVLSREQAHAAVERLQEIAVRDGSLSMQRSWWRSFGGARRGRSPHHARGSRSGSHEDACLRSVGAGGS